MILAKIRPLLDVGDFKAAITIIKSSENEESPLAKLFLIHLYNQMERYEVAQQLLTEAEKSYTIVESTENSIIIGLLAVQIETSYRQYQHDEVKKLSKELSTHLTILPDSLDTNIQFWIYIYHLINGYLYHLEGNLKHATKHYDQAMKIAVNLDLQFAQADCLISYGEIKIDQGKHMDALKFFDDVLLIYENTENLRGSGMGKYYRGVTLYRLGYLSSAISELQQGEEILSNLKMRKHEIACTIEIGQIYLDYGQLDIAETYFRKASNLAKAHNFLNQYHDSLHSLAHVSQRIGDHNEAINLLTQANALFGEEHNPLAIARNANHIIISLIELNNENEAHKYLKRLKQIAHRSSLIAINHLYRLSEALLYVKKGRLNNLFNANKIFEDLIQQEGLSHRIKIISYLSLCEILITEFKFSPIPKILQEINSYLQNLQAFAEQQNLLLLQIDLLIIKAKLAFVVGEPNESFDHLNRALAIIEKRNLHRLEKKIEDIRDQIASDVSKNLDPRKIDQLASIVKQSELSEYLNQISKLFKTS